jgi:cell division protein FtsA
MKYFSFNKIYTVIDIGTTKICTIIAQKIEDKQVDILGVGIAPSNGLRGGMVVNIGEAAASIKQSIQEAKIMSSYDPESAYVGISGSHIRSYYSKGVSQIRHGIVDFDTIEEATASSKAIPLQENQQLLHTITTKYIIDKSITVKNPLGMHGVRLEVESHIITSNASSIKDLVHCCSLAGIKTQDIILEPIASAESILNDNEKALGVLLVDIGGGTSDIAFYNNGSLLYTEIIPIAGNVFTNDLAICLKTSRDEAEELKKTYGIINIDESEEETEDLIQIYGVDGENKKTVKVSLIQDILESRSVELISLIKTAIDKYEYSYNIPSGIVFTGGGSLLKGINIVSKGITGIHSRIGIPKINATYKNALEHPSFATSYGLLLYAVKNNNSELQHRKSFSIARFFSKMKTSLGKMLT